MKEYVRQQLRIAHLIYIALLIGQGLYFFFCYFITAGRSSFINPAFRNSTLYYLLPVFTFVSILVAIWVGNHRNKKIQELKTDTAKVNHFRDTALLKSVLVELGNLYAITVAIITFSFMPLVFFGIGIVVFAWFYPSKDTFLTRYDVA